MLFEEDLSDRLSMPLDPNNNSDAKNNKGDKYSLRPRSIRRRCEFEDTQVRKKPKQKSAPLSKYRRKTANARERSRMREINQAFETLRKAVPQLSETHAGNNEKLTKITTLRLAMKYISTLSACLTGSGGSAPEVFSDCSEFDSLFLESDGESVNPVNSDFSSDHSADFCMDFEDPFTHFDPFLTDFS